ncbi:PAAR domain-containing protein, partial [Yersinia pestis subsp. pestis]|nr:PAAR domain-containing protein [Yersinia pestis subsp. pestis]
MAKGYYLVVGDETTCGGVITEGEPTHTIMGRAVAREQDRITCGKHPGTYIIVGHIPGDTILGRKFAGSLHSTSNCPCKARFIPSMMNDAYELIGSPTSGQSSIAPSFTETSES